MHTHYFTLKRQVQFLQRRLAGYRIADSFTQIKNEWIIQLEAADGDVLFLQLSCDPHFPFILLTENVHRQKNSTNVMEAVIGLTVGQIGMPTADRVIEIRFRESPRRLMLQFFTHHTHFFLVDEGNLILDSFKQQKKWVGQRWEVPASERLDVREISEEQFINIVQSCSENIPLRKCLQQHFRYLTRTVLDEILVRCRLPEETAVSVLNETILAVCYREIIGFFSQCETDAPRIYFQDDLPLKFSLGLLLHLSEYDFKEYPDINEALRVFCFQSLRYREILQKKQALLQRIQGELKGIQKILQRSGHAEDEERKSYYQKIGQLILAHLPTLQQGQSSVVVTDYFDPQQKAVEIKLDPELTPVENAERYFQKARRVEERAQIRRRKLNRLAQLQEELKELKQQAELAGSLKQLNRIEERLKALNLLPATAKGESPQRTPFKKFAFKDYEIWVGKSARDNDEMTFRWAHKEDWWLHVQGYSGSHVIIRNPARLDHPPSEVLHHAARLAVTFSEAKHARYVPVMVTKVKYVRKPRKSPPGTVIPERVKTVYADPFEKSSFIPEED